MCGLSNPLDVFSAITANCTNESAPSTAKLGQACANVRTSQFPNIFVESGEEAPPKALRYLFSPYYGI